MSFNGYGHDDGHSTGGGENNKMADKQCLPPHTTLLHSHTLLVCSPINIPIDHHLFTE
jgi:hypothetical protein